MKIIPLIKKASGESEPFSREKLINSLTKSGAKELVIEEIVEEIEEWIIGEIKLKREVEGIDSREIYKRAFSLLNRKSVSNAARYKLKRALMEMGPTGYPFEHFVGEIYKLLGYQTEVSQFLKGLSVTHEVDVVATKGLEQRFIECKYYLSPGKYASVQVPLYIHSRVQDIINKKREEAQFDNYSYSGGIVTNTRFTSDAEAYGECYGLHLLSWDYPKGNGLKEIIDREKVFPITSLTSLTSREKRVLMERGVVICRQLYSKMEELEELNLTPAKRRRVARELESIHL